MASTIPSGSFTAPHLLGTLNQAQPPCPDTLYVTQGFPSPKSHPEPKNVTGIFNYHLDPSDGSQPCSIIGRPETYERPLQPLSHVVYDIRGKEAQFTLDGQGFQVYRHISEEKSFQNEEEIKRVYYPEIEGILKSATGTSEIFIFEHTVRRHQQDGRGNKGPVQRVHVDNSYNDGPDRVRHYLREDADRLLTGRLQIINVWRPIKTVRKDPLGLMDATSIPDTDLVPVKLIYPDWVGESWTIRPNEKHKWYYLREQSPEEVLIFKCFDSKTDRKARRVPHSAFVNEKFVDAEGRESIEVRAYVFHPDDTE